MNTIQLLGRFSLFVIYFWFGILKVLDLSPAEPIVQSLFDQTLGYWMDFKSFNKVFGLIECFIGISWIIPRWTKMALILLLIHMGATFLPVILLPDDIWANWLIPTLIGQYIIKNLAMVPLGLVIFKLEKEKVDSSGYELG